jgi:hypothetical protein
MTRTLEELSALFDVEAVVPGSSAAVEQRWRGAVQSSGTTGFVRRRFTVSQNSAVRSFRSAHGAGFALFVKFIRAGHRRRA